MVVVMCVFGVLFLVASVSTARVPHPEPFWRWFLAGWCLLMACLAFDVAHLYSTGAL